MTAYKEEFRRRQEQQLAERERCRRDTLAMVVPKLRAIGRRHAPSLGRLFVFGSITCRGRFSPDSDIDVAVEWRQKGDYFGLWREIEEEVGREVDFRELGEDSFSRRVREHGLVIYESAGDQNTHLGDSG